jgi:hypothetical protein
MLLAEVEEEEEDVQVAVAAAAAAAELYLQCMSRNDDACTKGVLVLEHHTLKMNGGLKVQLHMLLTLTLDVGEWSALCFGCLYPQGKTTSTQ